MKTFPPTVGRVLGYTRVSTQIQAQDGYSLAAQEERIRGWAALQGYELPEGHVFRDAGISGRRDTRPGLEALLLTVQPGDIVVVHSLTRLGRGGVTQTLKFVRRIREAGGRLVSLSENIDTETPAGRMTLSVLASVAQLEVEQAIERSEAGRLQAASEGHAPIATPPYGYRKGDGDRMELHPETAPIVQRIYTRRAQGVSYHALADELNADGIPGPRDKGWYNATLMKLVQNTAYKGEYVYRQKQHPHDPSKWIVVPFPEIVDADVWAAAQGDRSSRSYFADPVRYPLTGHLDCGVCGTRTRGKTREKQNGRAYVYYVCRATGDACGGSGERTHPVETLHAQARELLARALTDPRDPARLSSLTNAKPTHDPHALERRKLELQIETLTEMRLNREIDGGEYTRRRGVLEERLTALMPEPPQPTGVVSAEARQLAAALAVMPNDELARWLDVLEVRFDVDAQHLLRLVSFSPL